MLCCFWQHTITLKFNFGIINVFVCLLEGCSLYRLLDIMYKCDAIKCVYITITHWWNTTKLPLRSRLTLAERLWRCTLTFIYETNLIILEAPLEKIKLNKSEKSFVDRFSLVLSAFTPKHLNFHHYWKFRVSMLWKPTPHIQLCVVMKINGKNTTV